MSKTYHRHRFPGQIIPHRVWLDFTFALSYRDVETMMLYGGLFVTDEALRSWCRTLAQADTEQICRSRPKAGDKGQLHQGGIPIKGKQYSLW